MLQTLYRFTTFYDPFKRFLPVVVTLPRYVRETYFLGNRQCPFCPRHRARVPQRWPKGGYRCRNRLICACSSYLHLQVCEAIDPRNKSGYFLGFAKLFSMLFRGLMGAQLLFLCFVIDFYVASFFCLSFCSVFCNVCGQQIALFFFFNVIDLISCPQLMCMFFLDFFPP